MNRNNLPRARIIDCRLRDLCQMRDVLNGPLDPGLFMMGVGDMPAPPTVFVKNWKAICLDAIDTEIAVLTQEMDAL